MPLRYPDKQLREPNQIVLREGMVIDRIHDRRFLGNAFNPTTDQQTRFGPIFDSNGNVVPIFYAASSLEAAICETIFQSIKFDAPKKSVPASRIHSVAHTRIRIKRDMRLVSLRNADLRKWLINRNSLINSSSDEYDITGKWSEEINRQFSDMDGLIWTSNQCDPDDAILFYGNRVSIIDLEVVNTRDGKFDYLLTEDVARIGMRSETKVVR